MAGLGLHAYEYQSVPLDEVSSNFGAEVENHKRSKRLTIVAIIFLVCTCALAITRPTYGSKSTSAVASEISYEGSISTANTYLKVEAEGEHEEPGENQWAEQGGEALSSTAEEAVKTSVSEQEHVILKGSDSDSDYSYDYAYDSFVSNTTSSSDSDTITTTDVIYGGAILGIGAVVVIGCCIGVRKVLKGKES
mmetsp:Transcript_25401/g.38188  ORF Transcript_25401/g.38188 Transcript_25401/m.38188 type:complete len:193 (-) Transcript_25401:46-624(-)